jgi:uncharacterized FlaG/YvyC family protein
LLKEYQRENHDNKTAQHDLSHLEEKPVNLETDNKPEMPLVKKSSTAESTDTRNNESNENRQKQLERTVQNLLSRLEEVRHSYNHGYCFESNTMNDAMIVMALDTHKNSSFIENY